MGYFVNKIRTIFWSAFYRLFHRFFFSAIGSGCRFEGWIDMPQKGGAIRLGNGVRICRFVEFSVTAGAELIIDDGVFVGRGVIISAHQNVSIGERTLLAEYVCIHDNNHVIDSLDLSISLQGFSSLPIVIGRDCWVAAHAVLVKGCSLGDHVIVGAGSVVNCLIADRSVAVGSPAKVIKNR